MYHFRKSGQYNKQGLNHRSFNGCKRYRHLATAVTKFIAWCNTMLQNSVKWIYYYTHHDDNKQNVIIKLQFNQTDHLFCIEKSTDHDINI